MTSDPQSHDSPPDLTALWRDWLVQAERHWSELTKQATPRDELNEQLAQLSDAYLLSLRNTNDLMSRLLETLQVPTSVDVAALSDRLSEIEARLGSIEDHVATLHDDTPQTNPRAPRRTRRPPSEPASDGSA